ncbi:MAG: TolC family protein, partial [Deferribacteraceae bacterium]|nr:TolC family protein [Deferribacteraceae bacterium]
QSSISITKALYNARLMGLELYPTLSGSFGASTGRDLSTSDTFSKSFSGELSLSYELDYLNKAGLIAESTELEYSATILDWQAARLTLVNSVVDVYYNIAYLLQARAIAAESLANYSKLYAIADARYNAGKTDMANRLQAEQSLLSAENSLLDIDNQLKSMDQSLRNLLNMRPTDTLDIAYTDLTAVAPLEPDLDVPVSVLAARPDLKAAEMRLESAFNTVQVQKRGWYPSISLRAALSSSAPTVGEIFSFPTVAGSLSISLPFLQWNTVKYNIKISETDYQSALLSFETTINVALNELAYYNYAYELTKTTLANSQQKNSTDQKLTAYHRARYEAGSTEMADLLSAINTESSSRRDILNNSYQLIKYENMIYKATGGRFMKQM